MLCSFINLIYSFALSYSCCVCVCSFDSVENYQLLFLFFFLIFFFNRKNKTNKPTTQNKNRTELNRNRVRNNNEWKIIIKHTLEWNEREEKKNTQNERNCTVTRKTDAKFSVETAKRKHNTMIFMYYLLNILDFFVCWILNKEFKIASTLTQTSQYVILFFYDFECVLGFFVFWWIFIICYLFSCFLYAIFHLWVLFSLFAWLFFFLYIDIYFALNEVFGMIRNSSTDEPIRAAPNALRTHSGPTDC